MAIIPQGCRLVAADKLILPTRFPGFLGFILPSRERRKGELMIEPHIHIIHNIL